MGLNSCRLTKLDSHLHQLADTGLIQLSERIILEDLGVIVSVQELTCIITGEAEGHLGQVVGTEAEEISFLSDFISSKCCSWYFNHCTNFILKFDS